MEDEAEKSWSELAEENNPYPFGFEEPKEVEN